MKVNVLIGVFLTIAPLQRPPIAQEMPPRVQEAKHGLMRVIAPEGAADSATIQRVLEAFMQQASLPGLPREVVHDGPITISLAATMREGLDAWTDGSAGLIVMRLSDVKKWSLPKLYRVLRHELVHVRLERYLGYAEVPWFGEGLAEWVAGGLTCEGVERIRAHLRLTSARYRDRAALTADESINPRLSYDLYTTFFEYLETRRAGAISSGELVQHVRSLGLERALHQTFGHDLGKLKDGWKNYMVERFNDARNGKTSCFSLP